MNDVIYREANALVRALLRTGPAANLVTTFARVWLRHARFVALLRKMRFDGVIDGGANVGEFTNLVRDVLPRADLVAIEPHPGNAQVLRKQGHRVIEAALWHKTGTLTLAQPTAASTSCTVMESDATGPTWQVEGIRLEDVPVSGRRLLVKLDLQGAEPQALEGMGSLWDRCAAFVVEVSFGNNGTSDAVARTMRQRGFEEYATLNELEASGVVMEADKVWVSRGLLETVRSTSARQ
jgi:FkbM family methyltransferase